MKNGDWLTKLRRSLPGYLNNILKVVVVLVFIFPFYWMFITSFKPYTETIVFPPTLWPRHFDFGAYATIFNKLNLLSYTKNSIIVTLSIVALQIAVMVPAAYAFAKYRFFGKNAMFSLVLVAFMIPLQITFISIYLMMAGWGLLPTLLPQIIPHIANAFGIFLLRQNFMQIPEEIIESAKLDNASEFKVMTRIMIPMSKSGMVTVALFSFVGHWNAYFWPLVMTDSEKVRPLTIALERLKEMEYGINWNIIMAGNVVQVLPVLILFVFASKKIIQAFAYKGVK